VHDAVRAAVAAAGPDAVAVIEGVGGLLVPLGPGTDIRDLAAELGLPLVIAARPGLGTINHTLLTLEAARSAGLAVAGVVMTPWPARPTVIERSNLETIAAVGSVEVVTLGVVARAEPELLAAAGAELPLERWLLG
jgi:dethiobiotin synthetase